MADTGQRPKYFREYKCWPKFFDALASGKKTFELRATDPDEPKPHDGALLQMREWNPDTQSYTGRCLDLVVTYTAYLDDMPFLWDADTGSQVGPLRIMSVRKMGDERATLLARVRELETENAKLRAITPQARDFWRTVTLVAYVATLTNYDFATEAGYAYAEGADMNYETAKAANTLIRRAGLHVPGDSQ